MTVQNPIVAPDDSDLGASAGKDTKGNGDDSLLATLGYKQGLSIVFHRPRAHMTNDTCRVQTQLFAVRSLRYRIYHHWPGALHIVCVALHQSHNQKS